LRKLVGKPEHIPADASVMPSGRSLQSEARGGRNRGADARRVDGAIKASPIKRGFPPERWYWL